MRMASPTARTIRREHLVECAEDGRVLSLNPSMQIPSFPSNTHHHLEVIGRTDGFVLATRFLYLAGEC